MAVGGYFNRGARRSGGDRRTPLFVKTSAGDAALRSIYLKILKESVAASGLTGPDLQEIYNRLDATDTDVLRECVDKNAVAEALKRWRESPGPQAAQGVTG
jgi:hypothetical protein